MPTLYWKSTCTTCREVRSALRARFPDMVEKNYSKEPLTAAEVRTMTQAAGGVAEVINTTHAIYKENGWKASLPDVETFVAAAVNEVNLLRRPILLRDDGKKAWVHKACLGATL